MREQQAMLSKYGTVFDIFEPLIKYKKIKHENNVRTSN